MLRNEFTSMNRNLYGRNNANRTKPEAKKDIASGYDVIKTGPRETQQKSQDDYDVKHSDQGN